MSGSKNEHGNLVVGGEPRIDFLPTETKKRKEYRRQRRSLIALVIVVAVACGVGFVFSTSFAAASLAARDAERANTVGLLDEQKKYSEVRTVQLDTTTLCDARLVGSATEVMWADYISDLKAGLPEGAFLRDVQVDSQSALETTPLVDVLLQQPHVAILGLGVDVPDLQVAQKVMAYIATVPAYADASSTSVATGEGVGFRVEITLDVNSDAFAKRFFAATPGDPGTGNPDTKDACTP